MLADQGVDISGRRALLESLDQRTLAWDLVETASLRHARVKRALHDLKAAAAKSAAVHRFMLSAESWDRESQANVLTRPLVACAIEQARAHIEGQSGIRIDWQSCEFILSSHEAHTKTCDSHIPVAEGATAIWSPAGAAPGEDHVLQGLMRGIYGAIVDEPTEEDVSQIRAGIELLRAVLPATASAALAHVHHVGVISEAGGWKSVASSSDYRLKGAIFLNRAILANRWWVAEHVLHEALHQQFYSLRYTCPLFSADAAKQASAVFYSPWNRPGENRWHVHRTLAAFHVYVLISLFRELAGLEPEALEGAADYLAGASYFSGSRRSLMRAYWLLSELNTTGAALLRGHGAAFVNALAAMLGQMMPPPSQSDMELYHVFDRYFREGQLIEKLQKRSVFSAEDQIELQRLAVVERAVVRPVLNALVSSNEGRTGIGNPGEQKLLTADFSTVRREVVDIITAAAWRIRLRSPADLRADLLIQMVETSSNALKALTASS